ncbi:hypothetical protein C3432_21365 [Citrobacter amalonaticus]|uniref:Uncharacterized protein n=1 Tax=Citrobacter amalonaticus TaxID=35703 RepID=A0A2S4RVH8_CITAM|nr:hypothetical protein C3432_21365 [Citrobacter amalonaticus]POT74046.1 hypothetical protein C3436_18830 [Citrobacter amalonaticus]POU64148.1 hypothetical protein C3430_17765 [Citrobacter amalonaticus]POV03782.1 hypothetical protein C3424_20680 [Citrobacter amalonaticus]
MGVNIIRSPGRIYTFQHLIFFTILRFESQIIAKIAVKSTPGNSTNPKLCHVLIILKNINPKKMWCLSQNMANFCAHTFILAPHPGRIRQQEELPGSFRWQTG